MANTKVTQELIADDAIGAAQLASNAVVTASIADDAVTSAKLDTNLSVAGSLTAVGTLTANAGINVDNINIDGTTIALSSGELILDSAGDITLDAGGGDWRLKDDGATICTISNVSGDLQLLLGVADKDFKFQGTDGASQITALQLDMSDAGAAIFNGTIKANGDTIEVSGATPEFKLTDSDDNNYGLVSYSDGTMDVSSNHGNEGGGADVLNLKTGGVTQVAVTNSTVTATNAVIASKSARITQVAITSSSNAVAWDSAAAANAYHVTTENTTFSAPSNSVEGAIISVELAQGGTVRTIAWNTVFEFAASTAPTVTATANKTDIFSFRYNGSVWQEIGRVQNLAQT